MLPGMIQIEILCLGDPALDPAPQIILAAHPDLTVNQYRALGNYLINIADGKSCNIIDIDAAGLFKTEDA